MSKKPKLVCVRLLKDETMVRDELCRMGYEDTDPQFAEFLPLLIGVYVMSDDEGDETRQPVGALKRVNDNVDAVTVLGNPARLYVEDYCDLYEDETGHKFMLEDLFN